MAAPRKYPDELRERAVRMVCDIKTESGNAEGACWRVGEQTGINPETLRGWVNQGYGIKKVWAQLGRDGGVEGVPVARCTVARLMKAAGLRGVSRVRAPRTTVRAAARTCGRTWSNGTSPRPPRISCGSPTSGSCRRISILISR